MIHIITTDDLPLTQRVKGLKLKVALLRDRMTNSSEEVREELRGQLRQALSTLTRLEKD